MKKLKDPFYGQIGKLVVPIVIQNLLSAAVSSADVIMLNFVGQSAIASVSLASQYANVLFMVFYGLGTGATMLCAQYYGKGDKKAIQAVEGIALRFSLVISSAFAVGYQCSALTGFPSTDYSTHTVLLHMTDYGYTRFEMGYACAAAYVLFILVFIVSLIQNISSKKWGDLA